MVITVASSIGGRSVQEDRFIAVEVDGEGALLAVLDGHGGRGAVDLVSTNLEPLFLTAREELGDTEAIVSTLERLDEMARHEDSGTTVSVAWVSGKTMHAHVGVIGDSLVAVRSPGQDDWFSPVHNVKTNAAERMAAIDRGAVFRDGYIWETRDRFLELSRTLGDAHFSKILNRRPETFVVPVRPGALILLATDGVGEPLQREGVSWDKRLLELAWKGCSANALVKEAVKHHTRDNASAIVCRI